MLATNVAAQQTPSTASTDSLLSYDLQEVVVQSEHWEQQHTSTVQRLPLATIEQAAAPSAAQVARYIPSAHVTTNSRGETLVYMRGAAERQTAIFFDGASLNIPWDNRLDLALIPTGIIGGMTVTKGAAAIEYGANVLGGVINLTSPALASEGRFTEASVLYGTAETVQANLTHRGRSGAFSYAASAGFAGQDGMPLPGDTQLPYNQVGNDLRTNTDRRIANGFARGVYRFGDETTLGVTLLHIDAVQGVAPEGHLPTDDARLWRYPDWRYTMGIVSGAGRFGKATRWKASAWTGRFAQTIDSYDSLDFARATARQEDDDLTFGTRLTLAQEAGPGTLRLVGNGLVSTHRQRDLALGEQASEDEAPRLTYRQQLVSLGAAYDVPVTSRFMLTLSGGYDVMLMPRVGDKPERDPFHDYSALLGARYNGLGGFYARGAAGRKTRFPTMRELFGEALNRFLVNPDLKPESALLAEIGLGLERPSFMVELIPFVNRTSGTIDQRNVTVDGRRLRQRINLKGSRIYGIEMVADARPMRYVNLSGHLTLMDIERLKDAPDDLSRLAERPEVLGMGALRYTGPQGLSALAEVVYTGVAYSLDEDDTLARLDPSLVLNARLGYRFDRLVRGVTAELFLRGDNLTNTLVVPQLGLPGPGRQIRAGVNLTL